MVVAAADAVAVAVVVAADDAVVVVAAVVAAVAADAAGSTRQKWSDGSWRTGAGVESSPGWVGSTVVQKAGLRLE